MWRVVRIPATVLCQQLDREQRLAAAAVATAASRRWGIGSRGQSVTKQPFRIIILWIMRPNLASEFDQEAYSREPGSGGKDLPFWVTVGVINFITCHVLRIN